MNMKESLVTVWPLHQGKRKDNRSTSRPPTKEKEEMAGKLSVKDLSRWRP
jgi:hypothetical protein